MSTYTYWDIVHIELSEGIYPLKNSAQGIFMVFWWRGIPLGHQKIEAVQLPLSATQWAGIALQAIAPAVNAYFSERGLEAPLPEPLLRAMPMSMLRADLQALLTEVLARFGELGCHKPTPDESVDTTICVIIPTCNRPAQLAACLKSLQALRHKPQELVIVDNAPQFPATRHLVEQFPDARYITAPQPGASAARNLGVGCSKASIIAFVDDDETVHPDWLTWLRQCFDDPVVMIATGLVLPTELQTEAQLLFENRFSYIRGYRTQTFDTDFFEQTRPRGVPVWRIGGCGNMAIRRDAFVPLGGFDERLGAGRAGCSEDTELFYRVLAHHGYCRYEPRAVTYHQHRWDRDSLQRQLFFYMQGQVTALLVQYAKHQDRGNLYRLFWTLPMGYAKSCLRCLRQDPAYQVSILRTEIAGYLAGIRFYWRHRGDSSLSSANHQVPCRTSPKPLNTRSDS